MISAVLDCVVYVQAAISPRGPGGACLELAEEGRFSVFASNLIVEEVRATLSKPKLRRRFPRLTDERVEELLQRILRIATIVADVPAKFEFPRDPDDAKYVDLADATKASRIVTRDNDLLSLMNDDAFRAAYPTLVVTEVSKFVTQLKQDRAIELGYE